MLTLPFNVDRCCNSGTAYLEVFVTARPRNFCLLGITYQFRAGSAAKTCEGSFLKTSYPVVVSAKHNEEIHSNSDGFRIDNIILDSYSARGIKMGFLKRLRDFFFLRLFVLCSSIFGFCFLLFHDCILDFDSLTMKNFKLRVRETEATNTVRRDALFLLQIDVDFCLNKFNVMTVGIVMH